MSALFDFDLLMVQADREGYYYTDWSKATPITVRAATKQDAINQAAAALGPARSGRYWTSQTKRVVAAAVTDSAEAAR